MDDRELVDRCIRGEARAWEALVERLGPAVYDAGRFTLRRVLGSAHRIIPGAGHINVASGYGRWPFVLEWLSDIGAR